MTKVIELMFFLLVLSKRYVLSLHPKTQIKTYSYTSAIYLQSYISRRRLKSYFHRGDFVSMILHVMCEETIKIRLINYRINIYINGYSI